MRKLRTGRITACALVFGLGLGSASASAQLESPDDLDAQQWIHHEEFATRPGLHAAPHETVILHLEPTRRRGAPNVVSIPYEVAETVTLNFCVPREDPHIQAISLVRDGSPAMVVHQPRAAPCRTRTLAPGRYWLHIDYHGHSVPAEGAKVFVHVPRRQATALQATTGTPKNIFDQAPDCNQSSLNWYSNYNHPRYTFKVGDLYVPFVTADGGVIKLVSNRIASGHLGQDGWSVCNWRGDPDQVMFFNGFADYTFSAGYTRHVLALDGNYSRLAETALTLTQGPALERSLFSPEFSDPNFGYLPDWHFGLHIYGDPIVTASDYLYIDTGVYNPMAHFEALYKFYDLATPPPPQSGEVQLEIVDACPPSAVGGAYTTWNDLPNLQQAGFPEGKFVARLGPDTFASMYPNADYSGTPQLITSGSCFDHRPGSLAILGSVSDFVVSTNQCRYCDLTGVDLSDANLVGGDFTGTVFNGANLANTNLQSAILDDAKFQSYWGDTILTGTNFLGAHLNCTDFQDSDLRSALFWSTAAPIRPVIKRDFSCRLALQWAHLNHDTFPFEDWRYLLLDVATISGASGQTLSTVDAPLDLSNARMSGTSGLTHIGLAGANLTGANLGFTDLTGPTDLTGANLNAAVLSGANFTGANLTGADLGAVVADATHPPTFNKATLIRAYLKDARLPGAFFRGAEMSPVNLAGADLAGAWLEDDGSGQFGAANLAGSYMLNTKLNGAHMNNVVLDFVSWYNTNPNAPIATGAGALLNGASFNLADLPGLDLSHAQLQGATLTNTQLIGANLTGARLEPDGTHHSNLSAANLRGANLTSANLSGVNLYNAGVASTAEQEVFIEVLKDPDHFQHPPEYVYFAVNRPPTVLSGDTITTSDTICPSGAHGPCGLITDPKWVAPVGPREPSDCEPSGFDAEGNVIAISCTSDRHPAGG